MDLAKSKTARIRELNDQLRKTFSGGQIVLTHGISSLSAPDREAILKAVREFTAFTEANDPREEHDFAAIEISGHTVFWKIDYYDFAMKFLSPDPSDPQVTKRVMTVMLAREY